MTYTKQWAVLPHGFLQVPAADRFCGSLDRPSPSARRFVCLIGFRDNFWYLRIYFTKFHGLLVNFCALQGHNGLAYEAGARVPCIVKWIGVTKAGMSVDKKTKIPVEYPDEIKL